MNPGGRMAPMWMVEVTKNKEATKEVLMRAIQDVRASSAVIKLVYVMTENFDTPEPANGLSEEDGLNDLGNFLVEQAQFGAVKEETFRREAAREMNKKAAEGLLRSFLSIAQQRNVSVSACVERCADREHGLCTATRRFHAERLYVAARKKLFSKSVPSWLVDCQSGLPPTCTVIAVQGEKKLYELQGKGSKQEDVPPPPPAQFNAPGQAPLGGLSAAQLQQHQQQFVQNPQQLANQYAQQQFLQQQYAGHFPGQFPGQLPFAGQQYMQYPGGGAFFPGQMPMPMGAPVASPTGFPPGHSASAPQGLSEMDRLSGAMEQALHMRADSEGQVPGGGAQSRMSPTGGGGGLSPPDVNGGSTAHTTPDSSGFWAASSAASGGLPRSSSTSMPGAEGAGATGGSAQTDAAAAAALAASAAMVQQQLAMLTKAAAGGGAGSAELQQQLHQVLMLQQQIQQQLAAASGPAGSARPHDLANNGLPKVANLGQLPPYGGAGASHSGNMPRGMMGDPGAAGPRSMQSLGWQGGAMSQPQLGAGPPMEVKFVRKERDSRTLGKQQLVALKEEQGEDGAHGDGAGGLKRQGAQGKSKLADELAALEDDDDDDDPNDSLCKANKWAASKMSMGKSVSSNRFPEAHSGKLPGTGQENRSGAHVMSSETSNRHSLQARAGVPAAAYSQSGAHLGAMSVGPGTYRGGNVSVGAPGVYSQGGSTSPRAPLGPEFFECRKFTPHQLARATNQYAESSLLGKGSFGQVFKGELLGCQVAVKKLEGSGWQGPEEFHMEVEVLSKMRHPNIVLLMGCCTEEMSLIYEFLPGGTLHDKLGPPKSADASPLAWSDRIRIASEMASALLYLHQNDPPIVHRDLKPDNILLDGHLMSKIGDVGLARLLVDEENMTMKVRGTAGYIDPEEVETCEISTSSDIYAFGLIMLQLLTGQRYVKNVHRMLTEAWKDGNTDMAVALDCVLKYLDNTGGEWPADLARGIAELALGASQRRRELRPDLAEVIHPRLMAIAKRAEEEVRRRKKQADSQFICPLSKELMKDPVVAADGFTYEREHISKWMATCNLSPSTGLPLAHTALTPNNVLKNLILSHKAS